MGKTNAPLRAHQDLPEEVVELVETMQEWLPLLRAGDLAAAAKVLGRATGLVQRITDWEEELTQLCRDLESVPPPAPAKTKARPKLRLVELPLTEE